VVSHVFFVVAVVFDRPFVFLLLSFTCWILSFFHMFSADFSNIFSYIPSTRKTEGPPVGKSVR